MIHRLFSTDLNCPSNISMSLAGPHRSPPCTASLYQQHHLLTKPVVHLMAPNGTNGHDITKILASTVAVSLANCRRFFDTSRRQQVVCLHCSWKRHNVLAERVVFPDRGRKAEEVRWLWFWFVGRIWWKNCWKTYFEVASSRDSWSAMVGDKRLILEIGRIPET